MMQFHFVTSGEQQLATSVDLPAAPAGQHPIWPTVIATHGLTGQRIGRSYHLVEFARQLNQHGIACVRFDQTGCGESTGQFQDLTIPQMAADTLAIRNWATQQTWCDADRMGFLGLSLGALPAIATEVKHHARCMALWAPVYDMPRVFHAAVKTGLRAIIAQQGWVPYRGLRIGKTFVEQLDAINTPKHWTTVAARSSCCTRGLMKWSASKKASTIASDAINWIAPAD